MINRRGLWEVLYTFSASLEITDVFRDHTLCQTKGM